MERKEKMGRNEKMERDKKIGSDETTDRDEKIESNERMEMDEKTGGSIGMKMDGRMEQVGKMEREVGRTMGIGKDEVFLKWGERRDEEWSSYPFGTDSKLQPRIPRLRRHNCRQLV